MPFLKIEGYDECIVGIADSFQLSEKVLIYDKEKILEQLRLRDRMTREEAESFFAHNIKGSYMGGSTPIFVMIRDFNQNIDDWLENEE